MKTTLGVDVWFGFIEPVKGQAKPGFGYELFDPFSGSGKGVPETGYRQFLPGRPDQIQMGPVENAKSRLGLMPGQRNARRR